MADGGTHGHARYRRSVDPIRPVRPDELALLPALELAADTMFESLGIGPLPGPGTVEEFAAALVVLVAGDPPVGLCRIDGDRRRRPPRAALGPPRPRPPRHRAGPSARRLWLGRRRTATRELTLATYREVSWNGPFYASEGFVEVGPVDDWQVAHGLEPEEPVMSRFGARVLMSRTL